MIPTTMERYKKAIEAQGFTIESTEKTMLGMQVIEASRKIGDRTLSIICGSNGTARIDKPNGTHKWVYEKTYAQIGALLKQTLSFYTLGR